MNRKALKEIQKEFPEWRGESTTRGHWKFFHPNGSIVVASGTPSDARAWKNFKSQLRRAERVPNGRAR